MMEYRISIGRKVEDSGQEFSHGHHRLQLLKAVILTVVALSAIIGIFLAALIIGSVVASLLLILLGLSMILWLVRWLFLRFARIPKKL
jgi:hypothetical protein